MRTVTDSWRVWPTKWSKLPGNIDSSGSRALLLVTSGGELVTVALGPENTAIFGLGMFSPLFFNVT
jgi:hypothetical protein